MFMDQLWMRSLPTQHLDQVVPNEALSLLNVIDITVAVASVADTTSFLRTDFRTFFITWGEIINNTTNRQPLFSVNVGGVQTTGYLGVLTTNTGGTIVSGQVTGSVPIGPLSANSQPGASGWLYIFNPASTANKKIMIMQAAGATATPAAVSSFYTGYFNTNANAVTGFQVAMSGGNIRSGTIRVYGIRGS